MKNLKAMLKEGKTVIGATLAEYSRPSLIKIYAQAGFDFVFIENEHGFFSLTQLTDIVVAGRDNDLPAVAKVGCLDRGETARLLDCGIVGIQLPRTNTRDDIDTLVSWMNFPPVGDRAIAAGYGNSDYRQINISDFIKEADETTLVVAHIETEEGAENADAIASNPQVDVVFIGPYDLSISLGVPGGFDTTKFTDAVEAIFEAAQRHGSTPGIYTHGYEDTKKWSDMGARFFEGTDELGMLHRAARSLAEDFRRAIPE